MEERADPKSLPTRGVEAVTVALLAVIVALVTMQVFMRYIMHSPLVWSEEMARMAFVWFVFIGAGLGFRTHLDLRIVFFTEMLPLRPRLWLRLLMHLIEVAFMALIVYNGWILCERLFPTPTPALYWSMDAFYGGVVGGGVVILVYALGRVVETAREIRMLGRSE